MDSRLQGVAKTPFLLVFDLDPIGSPVGQRLVAAAVLEALWEQRETERDLKRHTYRH